MEPSAAEPRRLRADAARNRQRLIDAAEEVFAARGLDATLDDIARHAGVNVATAYRHFDSKHELARAFLQADARPGGGDGRGGGRGRGPAGRPGPVPRAGA